MKCLNPFPFSLSPFPIPLFQFPFFNSPFPSSKAEAKFDWIGGFTVLECNDFAVRIKNNENGNIDWVHRRHVRKIKPRPEHLDSDSDDEFDTIADSTIENPKVKPVCDSSTGGGVTKVIKNDPKKVVDQSESKPKSKRGRKPKTIVPPTNSRPKRVRKSPDRLNIKTTKGRTYANVVAGK